MLKQRLCVLLAACLCCAATAAAGAAVGGEEDAAAFVRAFLASPYVDEAPDGRTLTLTQTESGWRAELADPNRALPTLTLCFTADGRIEQYENSAFPPPSLAGFAIENDTPLNRAVAIDRLRDALFPAMDNNACGVYARQGGAEFFAVDNFTSWLGLVPEGDALKVVAYGDFGTGEARYPGYLTRGEAAAVAENALAEAYGTSAGWAEGLRLMQGEFVLQAGHWTDAEVPLPYWFFVFGDEADGLKSQYTALIDAQTGEVLELRDPSETGNG